MGTAQEGLLLPRSLQVGGHLLGAGDQFYAVQASDPGKVWGTGLLGVQEVM